MTTISRAAYRLEVGDTYVELSGADGQKWSRLSLLASIDRVDLRDESYEVGEVRVSDDGEIELPLKSTAWLSKSVLLRCFDDRLELRVRVEGSGRLADAQLLGGRGVLPTGAAGTFRSSIEFASVFDPTPTEPVQVVRPASAAATLGVVGDAAPGRVHGIFSPPPLCLAFGRESAQHATHVPDGDWLSLSVVAAEPELTFTELRYVPLDGGFLVELDYDGHTVVDGSFVTPPLVIRPAADPWRALATYSGGPAPSHERAPWWSEPIFCGWGAQCARADKEKPADLARQDRYDEWLAHLERHDIVPGTIVIDDRWQLAYGTAEPDPAKWPDLQAWIARRHAAGQHVLLWWKAWDPEGLPLDECVLDPAGRPVAVDPGNPTYRAHLRAIVTRLIGELGADGFKVDFTQRAPAGHALRGSDAAWGIAALHELLRTLYDAAKAARPDALIVTHTPHPGFADVTDMIRLNDVLSRDPSGAIVSAADQLRFRHAVVNATMPGHLVDTDQWPIADRAQWRDYVVAQSRLGVPALYYAERIDGSGEELTADDFALVAETWRRYRS